MCRVLSLLHGKMKSQKISGEKFGDETEFSVTLSFWDEQVCVWHVKSLACEIFGSRTWKTERENKDLWATGHSTLITVERALSVHFTNSEKWELPVFPISLSLYFSNWSSGGEIIHTKQRGKQIVKVQQYRVVPLTTIVYFLFHPVRFMAWENQYLLGRKEKKLVAFIFQSLCCL